MGDYNFDEVGDSVPNNVHAHPATGNEKKIPAPAPEAEAPVVASSRSKEESELAPQSRSFGPEPKDDVPVGTDNKSSGRAPVGIGKVLAVAIVLAGIGGAGLYGYEHYKKIEGRNNFASASSMQLLGVDGRYVSQQTVQPTLPPEVKPGVEAQAQVSSQTRQLTAEEVMASMISRVDSEIQSGTPPESIAINEDALNSFIASSAVISVEPEKKFEMTDRQSQENISYGSIEDLETAINDMAPIRNMRSSIISMKDIQVANATSIQSNVQAIQNQDQKLVVLEKGNVEIAKMMVNLKQTLKQFKYDLKEVKSKLTENESRQVQLENRIANISQRSVRAQSNSTKNRTVQKQTTIATVVTAPVATTKPVLSKPVDSRPEVIGHLESIMIRPSGTVAGIYNKQNGRYLIFKKGTKAKGFGRVISMDHIAGTVTVRAEDGSIKLIMPRKR